MSAPLRAAMKLGTAALMMLVAALLLSGIDISPERGGRPRTPTAPESYAVWVMLDARYARSELPYAVSPAVLAARPALDTDRPVNPVAVERIAATGARIRYASRWLRAVAVDADRATLARITALPEVIGIVPLRQLVPAAAAMRRGSELQQDSVFYGVTWAPLRELNIPLVHTLGFRGAGVRIALLDTGFERNHETLTATLVGGQRDFVNNDNVVANEPGDPVAPDPERHGTAIWSLLAGLAQTRLVGGAYEATYLLAKVDVDPTVNSRADEDRWVAAVEWADSMQVHVISSSIGFRNGFVDRPQIQYGELDGNTTVTTRIADQAARRGILVVVAMGNDGPAIGTLWAPADADSVISVGAAEPLASNRIAVAAAISSRGPTADGRLKPDLAARGVGLTVASPFGFTAYESALSGSSYATPFITAAVALFKQAWPGSSVSNVREALRLAGSNVRAPDNSVGFGIPDVAAAIMLPEGLPVRVSGTDLQGVATTITPTFQWFPAQIHPTIRPDRYIVQIATDSLFANLVYTDTVLQASALTVRRPVRPGSTLYWRVIAESISGVRRTSLPQPPFAMPSWVRLLTLAGPDIRFISEPRPELGWVPLQAPMPIGPFTYDVQVLSQSTGEIVQQVRDLSTSSVRIPQPLRTNQAYRWRVIARTSPSGGQVVADTVESAAPFVVQSDEAPPTTILYQNFPNPFPNVFEVGHSGTRIWFDLSQDSPVELAVYDTRGRLIRQLIPARTDCGTQVLRAGLYGRIGQVNPPLVDPTCVQLDWDGRDHRGDVAARGVYILRLRAAGVDEVRRMVFLPN